ncbi:MAG: hypothetical protein BJ554DRAFT_2471, partial [Olpidium bornovanus]
MWQILLPVWQIYRRGSWGKSCGNPCGRSLPNPAANPTAGSVTARLLRHAGNGDGYDGGRQLDADDDGTAGDGGM